MSLLANANILILGDGNFSFSLSLIRRLETFTIAEENVVSQLWSIVATSFDSNSEVLFKYPESLPILHELRHYESPRFAISLIHGIDATDDLNRQLLATKTFESPIRFDYVIFNFPHLARENCRDHASMVAHIMHRVSAVLTAQGILYIGLAEEQSVRWKLLSMAQRNDLRLVSRVPIHSSHWIGYDFKRHQTGKSFKSKVKDCAHFGLSRNFSLFVLALFTSSSNNAISSGPKPLHDIISHLFDSYNHYRPSTTPNAMQSIVTPPIAAHKQERLKRRKVHAATESMYHLLPRDTPTGCSEEEQWQCLVCAKIFKSDLAARGHAYSVHIINATAAKTAAAVLIDSAEEEVCCILCKRVISNSGDALSQHHISKHLDRAFEVSLHALEQRRNLCSRSDIDIEVSTSFVCASIDCDEAADIEGKQLDQLEPLFECHICGWTFLDDAALQNHLSSGWRPHQWTNIDNSCTTSTSETSCDVRHPIAVISEASREEAVVWRCLNEACGRHFREERALNQHMNFCLIGSENSRKIE